LMKPCTCASEYRGMLYPGDPDAEEECTYCGGKLTVPTVLGAAVLEFLKQHWLQERQ
jgi:hypothetical protein